MTVMQLLNVEGAGSLEGFEFDEAVCKRAFAHYDKDKSGYLDAKECMKLADVRFPPSIRIHVRKAFQNSSDETSEFLFRNSGIPLFRRAQSSLNLKSRYFDTKITRVELISFMLRSRLISPASIFSVVGP